MKSKFKDFVEPRFDEIEAWIRNGVSEKDVAANLNISYSTFRDMKEKYPSLSALLLKTKQYVSKVVVEGALLKRATGFTKTISKRTYKYHYGTDGKVRFKELLKEEEQEIYYPPDVQAQALYLKAHDKDYVQGVTEDTTDGLGVAILPEILTESTDGHKV